MARHRGGWVKFHRAILDSDIGRNPILLSITLFIISKANWTDSGQSVTWKGEPRYLKPGQIAVGMDEIAKQFNISKTTVHKWLHYLEKRKTIILESESRGSIVTVCNYEEYQEKPQTKKRRVKRTPPRTPDKSVTDGNDLGNPTSEDTPRTPPRTPSERRANTNKEVKKEEEDIYREPETQNPIEDLNAAIEEWGKTLKRHKIQKDPKLDGLNIQRLIQRHGSKKTRLALLGAGYEQASSNYDPSKHVVITRLLKTDLFEKFVNLGAQNQPQEREYFDAGI